MIEWEVWNGLSNEHIIGTAEEVIQPSCTWMEKRNSNPSKVMEMCTLSPIFTELEPEGTSRGYAFDCVLGTICVK